MATNNINFVAQVSNKQAFVSQAAAMGQSAGKAATQGFKNNFSPALGKISGDFSKFRDSVDSATARVLAFTATTSLLYGTAAAFKRLTTDAIKVESVMTRIKSITNSTNDTIKTFQKEIFNLANQTSTSFEEAASAAEEFSRQGYNLNQTLDATKAALAIAKLSGKSAQSTIEGLTATMTTFGDKAGTFTDVAGKLLALDTKFATSAAGIINGLTRMAGVAEQAGLSFDEAASALAALKQETGRSEAVLGNSIKSIFTSIQSDKVIKELRSVGVEVESSGGEFRNLVDVVRDLSKAYDGLNDAQKAALRQNVAGKYQANAFEGLLSAFKQGGTFDKALQTSGDAKGQLDKRLDAIFGTSEAGLQRLSNRITEFGAQVGTKLGLPIANGFAKGLQGALDSASSLFSDNGKGIGDALISGIVNVIKGPGLILLGSALAGLFKRFAGDAIQAVGSLISINTKKEQGLAIDSEALRIYNALSAAEQARISNLSTVEQRQAAILAIMRQQLTAQEAKATNVVGPVGFSAANLSALQRNRLYGQIGRTAKSRASGDLPEQMAILRESADIRNGVGGARPTAQPKFAVVNLGQGNEKVVINTDERVVRNFAGSGRDAIINREMMGYSLGAIPNFASGKRSNNELRKLGFSITPGSQKPFTSISKLLDDTTREKVNDLSKELKIKESVVVPPKYSGLPQSSVLNNLLPSSIQSGILKSTTEKFAKSFVPAFNKAIDNLTKQAEQGKFRETSGAGAYNTLADKNAIRQNEINAANAARQRNLEVQRQRREQIKNLQYGSPTVSLQKRAFPIPNTITLSNSDPAIYGRVSNDYKSLYRRTRDITGTFPVTAAQTAPIFPGPQAPKMSLPVPSYPSGSPANINQIRIEQLKDRIRSRLNDTSINKYRFRDFEEQTRFNLLAGTSGRIGLPVPSPSAPFGNPLASARDIINQRVQRIGDTIYSQSGSFRGLSSSDKRFYQNNRLAFSENANNARAEYLQRRQQRASGIMGAGFIASIGGGALASRFTGPNGEETSASQKISGISNSIGLGATVAGLAGGGPIGLAAGAAIAAIGALSAAFAKGPDQMNKYKAELEDLGKKYERQSAAIDGYIQNFDALNEAIANGSQEAALAATSGIKNILKDADPALRQKLVSAGGKDDIIKISEQIKSDTLRQAAASNAGLELESLIKDKSKLADGLRGKANLYSSDVKKYVSNLTESVDISAIPEDIKKRIISGEKGVDLTQYSKQLQAFSPQFLDSFTFGSLGTVFQDLQQELENRIRVESQANQAIQNATRVRSEQANYQYLTRKSFNDQQLSNFRGSLSRREGFALAGSRLDSIQDTLSPQELLRRKADNDILKQSSDFIDQRNEAFKNVVEQAQGFLEKITLDRNSSSVISSAFTKFGENGNVNDLTQSLKGYLTPDQITKLQETSADQLLVLQKSYEELQSNNRITQATYQANLEQIRIQQKSSLFGAANPTASIRENLALFKRGIAAQNTPLEENRYYRNDSKGLPLNYVGRFGLVAQVPTNKQLSNESYRALSVNAERGRQILAGQDAALESGLFGFDFKPGSPAFDLREKFKENQRKTSVDAITPILERNRVDTAFADYDAVSRQILDEEKRKLGYSPFKEVDKAIRSEFGSGNTGVAAVNIRDYLKVNRVGSNNDRLSLLADRLDLNQQYGNAIPDIAQQYADKKFAGTPEEQLLDESKKSNEFLQNIQKSSGDLVKQIQLIGLTREQSILEAEKNKLNNRMGVINDYGNDMQERYNARQQTQQSLQDVVSNLAKISTQLESSKAGGTILAEVTNDLKISMDGVAVSQAVVDAITPIVTDAVYENLINQGFDIKRIPRK